jgi:hypothetical protein
MRKRYWVLIAFLALGGLGNLIGGTDTPVRGSVDSEGAAVGQPTVPVTASFDATLYVTASSLNLRAAPGTDARVQPPTQMRPGLPKHATIQAPLS